MLSFHNDIIIDTEPAFGCLHHVEVDQLLIF